MDRPIIMSAPMVRAILAGTKTETRRLLTPGTTRFNGSPWPKWAKTATWAWDEAWVDPGPSPAGNAGPYLHLPYVGGADEDWAGTRHRIYPMYWPGLRLWVREAWQAGMTDNGPCVAYRVDGHRWCPEFTGPSEGCGPTFDYDAHPSKAWEHSFWIPDVERCGPWASSRFMPRWASRITLAVTEVRVERLQEITDEGARAEGVLYVPGHGDITPDEMHADPGYSNYLNCRMGYAALWDSLHGEGAWNANPWVAVIRFVPTLANIDAGGAA